MKKGLDRYTNPKQIIKNRTAFIKRNYTTLSFRLNKRTDKKMIDYFVKANNKTQALRELYKKANPVPHCLFCQKPIKKIGSFMINHYQYGNMYFCSDDCKKNFENSFGITL